MNSECSSQWMANAGSIGAGHDSLPTNELMRSRLAQKLKPIGFNVCCLNGFMDVKTYKALKDGVAMIPMKHPRLSGDTSPSILRIIRRPIIECDGQIVSSPLILGHFLTSRDCYLALLDTDHMPIQFVYSVDDRKDAYNYSQYSHRSCSFRFNGGVHASASPAFPLSTIAYHGVAL